MAKDVKEPKKVIKHEKGGKINECVKHKRTPDPGPNKPK